MAQRVSAGVDVGGTFTDVVVFDGGMSFGKVSTTPEAPEVGLLAALARMRLSPRDVATFVHGSTIALNAILERRGVKTALVTTRGFRDVLEIMRTNRPDLYNLQQEKPVPLVPRDLRLEVGERIAVDGTVLESLCEEDVVKAARIVGQASVEAVAVCLVNAYANASHERLVHDIFTRELPGVPVMVSSALTREWREFERTSTTVANAYIRPLVERYVGGIASHFDGDGGVEVYLMQSNGGVGTLDDVRTQPVSLLMSGPVGGVVAAEHLSQLVGVGNLLTLDIGGTSADMCLITDGRADVVSQREVDRFPILAATVDVQSIGAGGGSVAWIDQGGALQCGPRSAGAVPGPACYGRGGTAPTVTDAHVVLGRIDPDYFLGGDMRLCPERAREAIAPLGEALRLSLDRAAAGVVRVIDLRMVEAVRRLAMRAGCDLRESTLLPFGGAGPLHGAELCRDLEITQMIVPVAPGTFSALGMLLTDLRRDYSTTRVLPVESGGEGELEALFAELEERARQDARDSDAVLLRTADMRYEGQEFTVNAPVPSRISDTTVQDMRASFEEVHERLYGYGLAGRAIVLVTARVSAVVRRSRASLVRLATVPGTEPVPKGTRPVFDVERHEWGHCPLFERGQLFPGARLHGPAVVEEPQSATVLGREDCLEVDAYGNLLVSIGGLL